MRHHSAQEEACQAGCISCSTATQPQAAAAVGVKPQTPLFVPTVGLLFESPCVPRSDTKLEPGAGTVTRYADIYCPRQVSSDVDRFNVTVTLTLAPQDSDAADLHPLEVMIGPVTVLLTVPTDRLEVLDFAPGEAAIRTIEVFRDTSSSSSRLFSSSFAHWPLDHQVRLFSKRKPHTYGNCDG